MIILACSILACIAPLMGLLIASSETLNYFTKKIPNGFFVNIIDSVASIFKSLFINLSSFYKENDSED